MASAGSLFLVLVSLLLLFAVVEGSFARRKVKIAAPPTDLPSSILAAMNQSVDPCSDFFMYSCGGWIANTSIPADSDAVFKSFTTIGDYNNAILKTICENATSGKVNAFYTSCMNTNATNAAGAGPLLSLLTHLQLADVSSLHEFMKAAGKLNRIGVPALFSFSADLDAKNPSTVIAQFTQGGVALPDPSLYTDPSAADLRKQYVQHVAQIFTLLGENNVSALATAQQVLAFETGLANISLPGAALLDPFVTYNKLDRSGLQQISDLPWNEFFGGLGSPNLTQINVIAPSFFSNLSHWLEEQSDRKSWAPYLVWQTAHAFAPTLSDAFVNSTFAFFSGVLEGVSEQPPRWETCIAATDVAVGGILGQLYANAAFAGASLQKAETMIHAIEAAMQANIETIDWMDNVTRAEALVKLGLVRNMVGYPPHPDTYATLQLGSLFFENTLLSQIYAMNETITSVGQPADPDAWSMTADTINAYYDPTHNEMVFPAGILQSPYFANDRPDPMNFGGAGVIMGHELTHGFDDQGRDYNGTGFLINWWQPATAAEFQRRADCIIEQYSQFEVLPNVFVNGNLTQGENIADCGGVKNSYHAYLSLAGANATQPSIVPQFTNIQLLFIAYAQGWCSVARPEYLKEIVLTDVHSPPRFRVLGPLINLPQFAQTFNCPVGSYMNPTNRCEVW